MVSSNEIEHLDGQRNAFGFLRLLFASLVIVSHATELFDGNRSREPLTQLFGTISFGELAVDGFFIISGYLVVGSYLKRPAVGGYLLRRVVRIYPGFVVASVISLAIVGPLAGADPRQLAGDAFGTFTRLALLQPPKAAGAFAGLPYPALNDSMWTIAYEFRCYLLVVVLGALGCFRRAWLIGLLAAVSLALFELVPLSSFKQISTLSFYSEFLLGRADQTVRFSGMFLMGALFFLLRDRIRFDRSLVLVMGPFVACLFIAKLAEPAVATLGAYIIFAVARWGASKPIGRINDDVDTSYGVYLYAWPTTQLLVCYWPTMPTAMAELITFAVAIFCGWVSWVLVEQPIISKVRHAARWKARTLVEAVAK